jgi:two-component system sensor histidine kinase KdpD
LAQLTRRRLERLTGSDVLIVLRATDGTLERPTATPHSIWLPIPGLPEPHGLIGLDMEPQPEPGSEGQLLLAAFARELGAAIERSQLAGAAQRAELEAETERMRSALLSVVSHDLKTPLAGIVASGSMLLEREAALDAPASRTVMTTLVRECERLARLLQNLLSMSRLESRKIELRKSPEAPEDIVASALGRLQGPLATRQVEVDLPSDLPCVLVEPALMEQVLLNLLENALRHTPPSARIGVAARADAGLVKLQVSDDGPGIHERERDQVFQEFFRGARARKGDGGIGLGLPICRAIVRAHGGTITIRDRSGGGTIVEFSLPAQPASSAWSAVSPEVRV